MLLIKTMLIPTGLVASTGPYTFVSQFHSFDGDVMANNENPRAEYEWDFYFWNHTVELLLCECDQGHRMQSTGPVSHRKEEYVYMLTHCMIIMNNIQWLRFILRSLHF